MQDEEKVGLYSREAYEILSQEWLRLIWILQYHSTFSWMGLPILQLPEDMIRLQEVVWRLKPDIIIEIGIAYGGSLLFYAGLLEAIGKGRVIGVDHFLRTTVKQSLASHPFVRRIDLIEGDSSSPETIRQVYSRVTASDRVMVILDSDHSKSHVLQELEAYAPLVSSGLCLLVQDGIMCHLADVPNGDQNWISDNPKVAADEFATTHSEFERSTPSWPVNLNSELRSDITYHLGGWFWRK